MVRGTASGLCLRSPPHLSISFLLIDSSLRSLSPPLQLWGGGMIRRRETVLAPPHRVELLARLPAELGTRLADLSDGGGI